MIRFFIDRPIFATVIAILMVLVGIISILLLPTAQYPQIAPPQVQVSATYTGASAQTVAKTVTTPLEEQINGVQGMTYMSSSSTNSGSSTITVTFDVGYDLNVAAIDVQNYASIAEPQLPDIVNKNGITIKKVSTNFIIAVNLISPKGTYNSSYLGNYADIHISDVLKRIPGVSDVKNFGLRKYAIRIWLDPNKLTSLGLATGDVVNAVEEQNVQVAAGILGAPPVDKNQVFQYQLNMLGRLSTVQEFEDIIVRTEKDGAVVRIKDVGRVELGAEDYSSSSTFNGEASATLGIYQLPGSNAIDISNQVKAAIANLSKRFPKDMKYSIAYDTTKFVKASLKEVVETLLIAILLVFGVVYLFLQDWRSTLIPCIAIPVALIGAFALLKIFGFSINTLSLLGLVLAVGLVVDDAIVVVENVKRQLAETDKSVRDATIVAMDEVKGPIITTTLILMAVFVPIAFIPGMSGQLYNQFALTIAFSVGLSGINSLSLSPALCVVFLRRKDETKFFFFRWFNQAFKKSAHVYKHSVSYFSKFWYIILFVFIGLAVLTIVLFRILPTGFVPEEDQGYFIVNIQGPDASSLYRTEKTTKKVQQILQKMPGVQDVLIVTGFNLIDGINQSNGAFAIAILKPWDERKTKELSVYGIMDSAQMQFNKIKDASIVGFNAPSIPGVSSTGGFQFEIQDLNSLGLKTLANVTRRFIEEGNKQPELNRLFSSFTMNVPQLYLDFDRTKARSLNVPISNVFNTLQVYMGSLYVNNFNKYGRVYKVILQADDHMRIKQEDILNLYARNLDNQMVPLGAMVKINNVVGPINVPHYNLYDASQINGAPAKGYSSGQAIQAMERVAAKVLPDGMGYAWTGIIYQQIKAGNLAPLIFMLSLVFVFLFLAALYESWSMPFMILLAVPLALFGAAAAIYLRGLQLDVYAQIGLVMLIGLSAKNAILIVEFAKERRLRGESIIQSAMEAARLRLRPILMTAFAFILGVLPLAIATGAGAASRHSIGTTVMGGMFFSTILSLVVVPVFYVLIETLREKVQHRKKTST